ASSSVCLRSRRCRWITAAFASPRWGAIRGRGRLRRQTRRIEMMAVLLVVVAALFVGTTVDAADRGLKLPLGLQEDTSFVPDDKPVTPEKIALGKQFFWDKRWSKSGTVACVSCHLPNHGWADPQQFSTNFEGKPTMRRAPTLVNRLFSDRQLWTGLRSSLEDQAKNDIN